MSIYIIKLYFHHFSGLNGGMRFGVPLIHHAFKIHRLSGPINTAIGEELNGRLWFLWSVIIDIIIIAWERVFSLAEPHFAAFLRFGNFAHHPLGIGR